MPWTAHTPRSVLPLVFEVYDSYDVQYSDTHEIVHVYEIEQRVLDDNPHTPPEELVLGSRAPRACRDMPKRVLMVDRNVTAAEFAYVIDVHVDQVRKSCDFSGLRYRVPNPPEYADEVLLELRRRDRHARDYGVDIDPDEEEDEHDWMRYRTDENNEMRRMARGPEARRRLTSSYADLHHGLRHLTHQELERRSHAIGAEQRRLISEQGDEDAFRELDAEDRAHAASALEFEYDSILRTCVFYETLTDYLPLVEQLGVSAPACRAPLVVLAVPGPESRPTFRLKFPRYPPAPAGYQRDRERHLQSGDFEEKEDEPEQVVRLIHHPHNVEATPVASEAGRRRSAAARADDSIFESTDFDHGEDYVGQHQGLNDDGDDGDDGDDDVPFPPPPPVLRRMGRFAGRDLDADSESGSDDGGDDEDGLGAPVEFPALDSSSYLDDSRDEVIEPVPFPRLGGLTRLGHRNEWYTTDRD